MLKDEPSQYSN